MMIYYFMQGFETDDNHLLPPICLAQTDNKKEIFTFHTYPKTSLKNNQKMQGTRAARPLHRYFIFSLFCYDSNKAKLLCHVGF